MEYDNGEVSISKDSQLYIFLKTNISKLLCATYQLHTTGHGYPVGNAKIQQKRQEKNVVYLKNNNNLGL